MSQKGNTESYSRIRECLFWLTAHSSLLIAAFLSCDGGNKDNTKVVAVGNRVPDFSLQSIDGSRVAISGYEGKVVILNFWATWCLPCQEEIPVLKEIDTNSEAVVIGIALDETGLKAVDPFVRRHGINYTILLGDEEIFRRYNGSAIPYTLVLDRSLKIIKIYRGPATRESLKKDLSSFRLARSS